MGHLLHKCLGTRALAIYLTKMRKSKSAGQVLAVERSGVPFKQSGILGLVLLCLILAETGCRSASKHREDADEVAAEIIAEAGFGDRVTIIRDDATEILPELSDSGPFCAVFLDADKGRYDLYGRWATENLRPGGLPIADNAYLFGRLLDDSDEAHAMRRFHEEMASSYRSVCLPTPDGLAVGVRLDPKA